MIITASYFKPMRILLLIALGAGFALSAQNAPAALASSKTYTVTKTDDTDDGACDGDCSLREAIVAANTHPGADTIILSAKAYILTIGGAGENAGATGDLDIADDLTIDGAGAGQTSVQGGAGWGDRIFDVVSAGVAVALNGMTITKGNASGGGGGVSNIGALTLNDSIVSGNTSGYAGGGIYHSSGGTLALHGSVVGDNTAGAGGGIDSVNATVLLASSIVSGNSVPGSGGGIAGLNSALTVDGSTISGNSTSGDFGGGISIGNSTLTMTNSTVSGNAAHLSAGGISISGSTLALANSTISGNTTAGGAGGGINNFGARGPFAASTATLNNVTIANNSAPAGGGIANGGTLELKNSLVAGNSAGSAPDCSGTLGSQGYNLLGNSAGCGGLADGIGGDRVGSAAQPVDPKLGPLQDNGGATFTRALLPGSPAIDAGSPASCAAADQRGVARPQGAGCDIGAYESDAKVKQSQAIDFNPLPDKTVGDPPFNISAAASSGLPVSFKSGTPGTCAVNGDTVTLIAAGACTIIASQSGNQAYNVAADVARTFQIVAQSVGNHSLYLPLVVR